MQIEQRGITSHLLEWLLYKSKKFWPREGTKGPTYAVGGNIIISGGNSMEISQDKHTKLKQQKL